MENPKITTNLHYICLNHVIPYLTPKEWPQFARVCETWFDFDTDRDFQEFRYIKSYSEYQKLKKVERLKFSEFLDIFKFVAPNLKYVKIIKDLNDDRDESDISVWFGKYEFIVRVNKDLEKDFFMRILLRRTKIIEKLKINSLEGATLRELKQFFQVNPINSFKFHADTSRDHLRLFRRYLAILPSKLTEIGLSFSEHLLSDEEQQQMQQFLRKLPLLTKVRISHRNFLSPLIINQIAKHSTTMRELSLRHRFCSNILQDMGKNWRALSIIQKCKNLTKLSLTGFALRAHLCRPIARNCQSIRCLKLLFCDVSEKSLQVLMSLPNLRELHINPIYMNLTRKVPNLKKLVIVDDIDQELDSKNLAIALDFMPNLSSLELHGDHLLTEEAADLIRYTIHSRGRNIFLYSFFYPFKTKKVLFKKISPKCQRSASKKRFAFIITPHDRDRLEIIYEMMTKQN